MKRIGNLYDEVFSIENLREAHQRARKGKGWYAEVIAVDNDLDNKLEELSKMMKEHRYRTSEYTIFKKKEGKKVREICKLPYYPDRIAQWAVMLVIEKYLTKNLIIDTYSAIKGRGIHKGLKKIKECILNDAEGTKYCLKMDVHHYYASINHDILKATFARLFKDPDLLWLIGEIIDSTPGDTGIPIGNYLSQWSGNIYLSRLDHWLKEVKHVKYYFRYMDDMIILCDSKETLHQLRKDISEYLETNLKLELKSNWQVFPTLVRGIDFLGYRVFRDYVLLRQSIADKFKSTMLKIKHKVVTGKPITYHDFCSANSYKGWLKHCDSWRIRLKYLVPIQPSLDDYYRKEIKNHGTKTNRLSGPVYCQA